MLTLEGLLSLDAVAGDPDHFGPGGGEGVVLVAELAGLLGAPGGVGLGVEEEDNVLLTLELREADHVALGGLDLAVVVRVLGHLVAFLEGRGADRQGALAGDAAHRRDARAGEEDGSHGALRGEGRAGSRGGWEGKGERKG